MSQQNLILVLAGLAVCLAVYSLGFIAGYESAKKVPREKRRRSYKVKPKFKIYKSQLN